LHGDRHEGPLWLASISVGTRSRILPPGEFFELGHISAINHDIFTTVGALIKNEAQQNAEWSKYTLLENPKWQMASILNYLNRYSSATDCPISLKFCMVTDMKVPDGRLASTLKL